MNKRYFISTGLGFTAMRNVCLLSLLIATSHCYATGSTTEQKGEIIGAAGFGAVTLDRIDEMQNGAAGTDRRLSEVNRIAKEKVGYSFSEIASHRGRDVTAEANDLIASVIRYTTNFETSSGRAWLAKFRAEYENNLTLLKSLN